MNTAEARLRTEEHRDLNIFISLTHEEGTVPSTWGVPSQPTVSRPVASAVTNSGAGST